MTRVPVLRLHVDGLIVDNFAGGGGASTGITLALADAFWSRVEKAEGDACWRWSGSLLRRPSGAPSYGLINLGARSRRMLAHRFSYLLNVGALAPEQVVRHRCDNPQCVRPDHLEAGTQAQNLADMRERGRAHFNRFKPGTAHPNAKMDAEKVREIRRLRSEGMSLARIGAAVGLNASTVHDIVRGRTWKEVA